MSAPRRFLIADDELHAEVLDALVCAYVCDIDGNHGSRWSGVYSDGTRFGIAWGEPVAELFGVEVQPVDAVQDAEGEWDWQEVPQPELEDMLP